MDDIVTETELTPKQLIALDALLSGKRASDAAEAAGVSATSVYRWLNTDEAFAAAMRAFEATALQDLGRKLGTLGQAVGVALEDGLNPAQPIGIRLRAADTVLSRLLALAELTQVIARLEALEGKR